MSTGKRITQIELFKIAESIYRVMLQISRSSNDPDVRKKMVEIEVATGRISDRLLNDIKDRKTVGDWDETLKPEHVILGRPNWKSLGIFRERKVTLKEFQQLLMHSVTGNRQ